METPILELILQDMERSLYGIKETAGYSTTVHVVERFRRTMFTENFPAVALYCLREDTENEGNLIDAECRIAEVAAEGYIQERLPGRLDQELVLFQCDLYTALFEDPQWNGQAIDTLYGYVEKGMANTEGTVAYCTVHAQLRYRFPIGRPWG